MTVSPPPSGPMSPRLLPAGLLVVVVVAVVAALLLFQSSGQPAASEVAGASPGGGVSALPPINPSASGSVTPAARVGSAQPPSDHEASATAGVFPTPAATPGSTPAVTPRSTPRATPRATPTRTPTAPPAGLPAFHHVYVVVMENEESASIVGNSNAPYINSLIDKYGLATNYTAVDHPSEPNYLALFSGSTHGVNDDAVYNLSGKNLADQIEAHGRDWRVYAQNLPDAPCFTGTSSSGGPDGSGEYARKHNPAISFTDISGNPARCAKIQDFSHFSPTAADFELIVPNLCNDMHDCSVKTGDTFLHDFLPKILGSPVMARSAIFLTWDEGSTATGGGGKVATVVIGPGVPAGFTSGTRYTHYSLVHTIETAWRLGCLASACNANDLRAFWP